MSDSTLPETVAKATLILEMADGTTQEVVLGNEGSKWYIRQERGVRRILNQDGDAIALEHNGQTRACVKVWHGAEEYDDIVLMESVQNDEQDTR